MASSLPQSSSGSFNSNPTYSALTAHRDGLRASKVTDRRNAAKSLLEKLHDLNTPRRLEAEALRMFENANAIGHGGRGNRGDGAVNATANTLPWDRVCVLYRSVLDAALLSSRTLLEGKVSGSTTGRGKKKVTANQSGFTGQKANYNADELLFPYKVFLRMDADLELECNDGGYNNNNLGREEDWKTRSRYGHHVDLACVSRSDRSKSSPRNSKQQHFGFNATRYVPHVRSDDDRGSRLSYKEVAACVDYAVQCLNDDEAMKLPGVELSMLQWLAHMCSRPAYLAELEVEGQLGHILHELSTRLGRAFVAVDGGDDGRNTPTGDTISQESLLAASKCLGSMMHNCTSRLGMSMHLFVRPVLKLVADWAEDVWILQSGGGANRTSYPPSSVVVARNPHARAIVDGQMADPSSLRRKLRTESDMLSVLPYMYLAATSLLAAHPEQCVPVLSDYGHSLLRLARRNYGRPTTSAQSREALTEYIGAHLLVAETSGKLSGLPEGDLGPLVPRSSPTEESGDQNDGGGEKARKPVKKRKRGQSATLDVKTIDKLLEMLRDEKVRESLFGSSTLSGQDLKKKKDPRRSILPGRKYGKSDVRSGGAAWIPLTRRQRRHFELMARLLRISQRLHLSEAEDRGHGDATAVDTLDLLVARAEEEMMRSSAGIEQGEIDIVSRGQSVRRHNEDYGCVVSPVALARSPWTRTVARHLYKLNPKLHAYSTITQMSSVSDDLPIGSTDVTSSFEQILLESCPALQGLVVNESSLLEEAISDEATMTQGTLATATMTPSNNSDVLDSIRPTTVATLQFLCACVESYPRGECWASSTRQYWSTILDEGHYPDATLANVLERHGSSPADAAAVVYLLGTTLEFHGGSAGDDEIQMWTVITLLKMTESAAIICSREGLADAATFGSPSSMLALRLAWQYVWKTLFRFDLRYSSYTSGAFGNNVGELVVQLLTQIIRYKCTDRECLFACRPHQNVETGTNNTFIRREQGQLWKLPVFEDASCLLSCAPFELITNAIRLIGFNDAGDVIAPLSAADSIQMTTSIKDRRYFVTYCLQFIQLAMKSSAESRLRRSFLPYAATCMASLIRDGEFTSVSTYELDALNMFATTEDSEPMCYMYDPDSLNFNANISINQLYAALWSESITPNDFLSAMDHGLTLRIAQGRGTLLNTYLNAQYEREQLRRYLDRSTVSCADAAITTRSNSLARLVFDSIKSGFDELLIQLKYDDDDGNASDVDEETDVAAKASDNLLALPQVSAFLSIMLTILLSSHFTVDRISQNICDIFEDTFVPALDLMVEKLPSLKSYPSDFLVVFNHLHGIIRVLTFISALGGDGAKIHRQFGIPGKSLLSICKSFVKEYRNQSCGANCNYAALAASNALNSDSDDDGRYASSQRIQPSHSRTQHSLHNSNNSDDSDGLMDDDDDDAVNKSHRPRPRAPPPKRRRVGNGSHSRLRNESACSNIPVSISVDAKGAWACSSLMLILLPSFQSLEFIASHLVWPDDFNNQAGYGTLTGKPDPYEALVCSSLFCQKAVLLRQDRLDLKVGRGQDTNEEQESALILCLETILHVRRSFPPSSKHYMRGLGQLASMVKISEYSECCGPIPSDESKMVLEVLHPEGIGKESSDYFLLRRWTKRILKYRNSYHSQQVLVAALTFIYAQTNLRKEFESSLRNVIYNSFCHIDENVRSLACDLLGAALLAYPDQNPVAYDVLKNALPKLDDRNKIRKWVEKTLVDQKLRDEMVALEDDALIDAEASIEYNSVQCMGMIAGHASHAALARDMIWRLIDLASKRRSLQLPCYRACKRASVLLQHKSVGDMFDNMMPHLLVKWLDSGRSLQEFPLLLMSPFAIERICRYLPIDLLLMLQAGEGWSDTYFCLDVIEGESQTLNERILTTFVGTVAQFLIPNILLASSDEESMNNDDKSIDATKYLTECVLILTGNHTDHLVAKVLCSHIKDLYGYVAVLAEDGDATFECENAFKLLKRCVSTVEIEKTGARCCFLVLRHILLLHCKGISIVGRGDIKLSSTSYIEGMKYVSKQLKASSNRKDGYYLEQLGSSLTECFVITKYWLSSSQTSRQREESWSTLSLLCDILIEYIGNGTVESGELGFCLHSFIAIILDPANIGICSLVLSSLNAVLGALFSTNTKEDLVMDVITVLHKLSLALIQTHQRAYEKLYLTCASTLRCLEYEQKSCQGLLSGFDEPSSLDNLGEVPWGLSVDSDAVLKNLITSKADLEELLTSETMLGAYGCLEIIANSERMQIEDILGAEDILIRNQKEEVFRDVNEKYSILTFFDSIQQKSTKTKETSLMTECEHFIRVLSEHPISFDEFESSSSYSSNDVLARLLALRRLEKALVAEQDMAHTGDENLYTTYSLLLNICQSREPEQSRVISSRCLGELNISHLSTLKHGVSRSSLVDESLIDPILSIKKTILTSLGQFLLSDCADSSLIAMKTAKALLATPVGKEYWMSLDGDIKALLSPFIVTHDDGKVRKEAIRVSDNCMEQLKSLSGCPDDDSWCWHDKLWTLDGEENSCELWIRKITSSIISCSYGKGSKIKKGDQDFFRICQGLCAKEASFAACIFPALIFHLLDSEARDECARDGRVRDVIMTNIAIGSSTSRMNGIISHCFARILSPKSKHQFATQAVTVVLNTLELLRVITEVRFLTSSEHTKNKKSATTPRSSSAVSNRQRSNNSSASMNAFEESEKWRGFPYGVVLRVSGLDVAQACLSVKRYYSALYYAEMSMNNLIGSGTFFEDVATNDSTPKKAALCQDISGFGVLTHLDDDDQKSELVLEQALLAKDIIGRCLSELNAKDELRGVLSQGSALYLKQNISCLLALDGCRRDQPIYMLSDLDNEMQTGIAQTHAGTTSGVSAVTSCLEDLGLHHIKQNYLFGVGSKMDRNDLDRRFLREKWFEDALNKTSQWDNSLLPMTNDGDGPFVMSGSHNVAPNAPSFSNQPTSSFYESVYDALQSLAKNDATVGLDYALHARRSVLANVQNLAGSEALSTGMVPHLTKLSLIGHLELLSTTLAGTTSLSFLLRRWGYAECFVSTSKFEDLLMGHDINFDTKDHVDSIDGSIFRSLSLESSVKEISLKILANNLKGDQQQLVMKALTYHIYKSCSIYRELGHPGAAKVSLSSLRSLILAVQKTGIIDLSSADKLPLMLRLEDARCSASDNDLDGAIMTCKMIANHLIISQNGSTDIEYGQIRADSLLLGGIYMAHNNVDSVETVLSSFFEKAAGLAMQIHKTAPTNSNMHRASIASFKLGEFAASLYNSIDSRVSSDAWRRRNITAQERSRELQTVASRLKEIQKKSRNSNDTAIVDLRAAHGTLSKEVEIDARERQSVELSMHRYLQLAVDSYCNALKVAPASMIDVSKHVFQLISIWFKNCQRKGTQDIVNKIIKSSLSSIPSYRLVPLTYQLFSRIDEVQQDDNSGFQSILRDIVCKICSEHPYHGIVQLLALSNGQRIGGGVNGRQGNMYLENVGTAKVNAVNGIIQDLRKSSPEYVCAMLDSYETLMSSYMDVAELETSNIQKKTTKGIAFRQYKLNLDSCLSGRCGKSSTNFAMPAIITKPPMIRPDGQYGQGKEDPIGTERVVSFESTFDLTPTGIHRPKIVMCIGSKGGRFKQLVKGEDDLRQDAIMEQVFGTVNDLLRNESSSGTHSTGAARRLRLITYGITPLSPTSGVLEWVDNTQCFGDFLTDRGKNIGAHSKYYPGEWGGNDCREFYRSVADDPNATQESKRQCYDKICDNYSPAFRFFFLENFKSSMEAWHTARTLYTRSCAVSSIVGHILGIGDRHTSNILVHTKTGEVVHIDFGIVFEQGKTLATPEVVPFRLTRDMVDGMGPSGTDGVFSKAAEATVGVMRSNADTLLTILSAVVSDPLYKWSLSPQMATQHQRKNDESRTDRPSALSSAMDENRNDAADRAIAKIHEKLQGYEDGTSGEHKTIAGQVKLLINEARDHDNLCVMFSGWAPWV